MTRTPQEVFHTPRRLARATWTRSWRTASTRSCSPTDRSAPRPSATRCSTRP